jgi:outer membrane murein-binding lipoprotein Lpp
VDDRAVRAPGGGNDFQAHQKKETAVKTLTVLLAVVLAAFTLAAGAAAAPSPGKLERQVNQLKSKVSALQGRVASLEARVAATEANLRQTAAYAVCGDALIIDAIRAIVVYLGFPDPGRLDDQGACASLGITRPRTALAAAPRAAATAAAQLRLVAGLWRHYAPCSEGRCARR